jgi:hypothetical protein
MAEPNYYETLGVSRNADRESIRKAYIALARASHPDRQSSEGKQRSAAEARIRAVNHAWNVLSDPTKRRDYDLSLPDPVRKVTPQTTRPDLTDRRPPPPSGILVPASTAALWKWLPVAFAVLIGVGLIVGSAYATSQDGPKSSSNSLSGPQIFTKGSCVVVTPGPSGKVALVVTCDKVSSGVVDSVVETPRPCPPPANEFQLFDGKTTLCLVPSQ